MSGAAAEFMRGEVLQVPTMEKEPGLLRAARKAGDLGFLGTDVPEQFGGLGLNQGASR